MLSKSDYRKYVEQMRDVEIAARDLYAQGIKDIDHEAVKNVFSQIMADEERHIKMAEELAKLFNV